MIVVAATLLALLTVPLTGGRLRNLARLDLRHLWIVWAAIAVQTVLFEVVGSTFPEAVSQGAHLLTYAMAFAFLWLNRHVPGALVIALGAGCNGAAIAANGGVMPASAAAWARAGHAPVEAGTFENSDVVDGARLAFLGDVFAIPAGWPLANVFSIGDVVVVVGAAYLAHRCCRRPMGGSAGVHDGVQALDQRRRDVDGGLAEMDDDRLAVGHDERELALVAVAGQAPGQPWPPPPMSAVAEARLLVGGDPPGGVRGPTRRQ